MRNIFLSLLATGLLMGSAAQAQTPTTEVQNLSKRLNELVQAPSSNNNDNGEVLVSLANCGVRQTFRKYRVADKHNATAVNVSSSKKGGSWGMQTDNKVELEISLGLDWVEVGSIGYSPKQDEKTGRSYYNLTVKRREPAKSSPSPGLTDTITFSLHTQNKKEVAQLVQRLTAVSRECRSQKG